MGDLLLIPNPDIAAESCVDLGQCRANQAAQSALRSAEQSEEHFPLRRMLPLRQCPARLDHKKFEHP
jgi:hypothetical protein